MNNKRGFTLVELLAVIAIIGIISTIGVLSYGSIKNKILEQQYKNLELKIVSAGKKYLVEREITQAYVQDLIDAGIITAEKKGKIYNPVDNEELNCYYISLNDSSLHKGNCQSGAIDNGDIVIKYSIDPNGRYVSLPSNWIKASKIYLKAAMNGQTLQNVKWTTRIDPNKASNTDAFEVTAINKYLDTSASVTFTDEKGKTYKKEFSIKLDAKAPELKSITAIDNNAITKSLNVSFDFCDNESGLKQVLIKKDNSTIRGYTFSGTNCKKITYQVTQNGTYYFEATDMVGNTNKDINNKVIINNVDNEAPKGDFKVISSTFMPSLKAQITCNDNMAVSAYSLTMNTKTPLWQTVNLKEYKETINITKSGTYFFECKDKVGFSFQKSLPIYEFTLARSSEDQSKEITANFGTFLSANNQIRFPLINSNKYDCVWKNLNTAGEIIIPGSLHNIVSQNKYVTQCTVKKPIIKSANVVSTDERYNSNEVNISLEIDAPAGLQSVCILNGTNYVSDCNNKWIDTSNTSYKYDDYIVSKNGTTGEIFSLYFYAKDQNNVISDFKKVVYKVSNIEINWGECPAVNCACKDSERIGTDTIKYDVDTNKIISIEPYECNIPNCESCSESEKIKEELEKINGIRYVGCLEYYITTCNSTLCSYTSINGENIRGSIIKNNLTLSKESTCDEAKDISIIEEVNDYRFNGCDIYYIESCEDDLCYYNELNGVAQLGAISKDSLNEKQSSECVLPSCEAHFYSIPGGINIYVSPDNYYCKITDAYINGDKCSNLNKVDNYNYTVSYSGVESKEYCSFTINSAQKVYYDYDQDKYFDSSSWNTYLCGDNDNEVYPNYYCTGISYDEACKNTAKTACDKIK